MNFKICIYDYTLDVAVTHYVNQPAQGKWADSDWDCYGYEDVEFKILSGRDEERGEYDCSEEELKFIENEFSEEIEEKLLEEIREMNSAIDDAYEGQRESDWEY